MGGSILVKFYNVSLSREKKLNGTLNKGDFFYLICNNKEEKQVFLQKIARIKNSNGSMMIGNKNFLNRKDIGDKNVLRKVGIMYSDYKFLESKNVRENLEFYLKIRGYSKKEIKEKVDESIKEFALEKKEFEKIRTLTSLEKMIVSLNRAIIIKPEILIIEDAHMNLKDKFIDKFMNILKELSEEDMKVLYVTEDRKMIDNYKEIFDGNIGGV